jgi:hypothetical protein
VTTCTICHFPTEMDDVALGGATGRCICLRCYTRETGTQQPMPRTLWRILSAALAEFEPA